MTELTQKIVEQPLIQTAIGDSCLDINKPTSLLRPRFWQNHHLSELNHSEWEALCDGCGSCCLIKFLDDEDEMEEVTYTNVGCQLLDCSTGWCSSYDNRHQFVPDCITLEYDYLSEMMWLPNSCAYKRLYIGLDLPDWHHLITGDKQQSSQMMREQGVGVAQRCVSEVGMSDDEMEERIITWVEVG